MENIGVFKYFVFFAGELEAEKMVDKEKMVEVDNVQNEVAEKERAVVVIQQKVTGIQNEDAQLKESSQKKEGKHILDVAVCEEYTGNQNFGIICR